MAHHSLTRSLVVPCVLAAALASASAWSESCEPFVRGTVSTGSAWGVAA
jgi:hypothetical protein